MSAAGHLLTNPARRREPPPTPGSEWPPADAPPVRPTAGAPTRYAAAVPVTGAAAPIPGALARARRTALYSSVRPWKALAATGRTPEKEQPSWRGAAVFENSTACTTRSNPSVEECVQVRRRRPVSRSRDS
jgi:hypothetical protein